MMWA